MVSSSFVKCDPLRHLSTVLIFTLLYCGVVVAFYTPLQRNNLALKSSGSNVLRVSPFKRSHARRYSHGLVRTMFQLHAKKSASSTVSETDQDDETESLIAKAFVSSQPEDKEMDISFVIFGDPIALARHRVSRFGFMYNPAAKQQKRFLETSSVFLPDGPLTGPLEVKLVFYFARPQSHYGSRNKLKYLKEGMDTWHVKKKDVDNLAKFVLDSLNKRAYEDDCQIVVLTCAKAYVAEPENGWADAAAQTEEGTLARTQVQIRCLKTSSHSLLSSSQPKSKPKRPTKG